LTDGQVLYYSDANLLLLRLKSITLPTQKETKEFATGFSVLSLVNTNATLVNPAIPPNQTSRCVWFIRELDTNKTPRVNHSNQLADI
jgi:hypothetical protein